MEEAEFRLLQWKVASWANNHAHDDFLYGSHQSYWQAALNTSLITKEEYDHAAAMYGERWMYRGD